MSPLATGYEHPDKVPDELWREYLTPIGATIERARLVERMLTALDPAELEVAAGRLCHLEVPVLLVWGTAEEALGVEWAYRLRDLIPGVREVVEVDGGKLFYPRSGPRNWPPSCAVTGDADHYLVLSSAATGHARVASAAS